MVSEPATVILLTVVVIIIPGFLVAVSLAAQETDSEMRVYWILSSPLCIVGGWVVLVLLDGEWVVEGLRKTYGFGK